MVSEKGLAVFQVLSFKSPIAYMSRLLVILYVTVCKETSSEVQFKYFKIVADRKVSFWIPDLQNWQLNMFIH